MTMTPRAYLIAAGEALYGTPRFYGRLAADLGTARQVIQREATGTAPISERRLAQVRALLRARGGRIDDLLRAA